MNWVKLMEQAAERLIGQPVRVYLRGARQFKPGGQEVMADCSKDRDGVPAITCYAGLLEAPVQERLGYFLHECGHVKAGHIDSHPPGTVDLPPTDRYIKTDALSPDLRTAVERIEKTEEDTAWTSSRRWRDYAISHAIAKEGMEGGENFRVLLTVLKDADPKDF